MERGMEPIPGIEAELDKNKTEARPERRITGQEKADIGEVQYLEDEIARGRGIYERLDSTEWKRETIEIAVEEMLRILPIIEIRQGEWGERQQALTRFMELTKIFKYNGREMREYFHRHQDFNREDFEHRVRTIQQNPFFYLS